ncbi:FadR/GntR family transcriptional regulator [Leucobacter soli]|uniref:L-lactate dehydrogenase operon regulatory protein n=2 Tax=Leucobacter soli TaxID=2812850 RepID=A0A916JZY8_9MICO|nr:FCD domain-containing protein [Leucobacter soli]CAG7611395.1 Putative L-lactate dehydrogenase operon regulatory protein [Leucobacter soli]
MPSDESVAFLTRTVRSANPYEQTVQRLLQTVHLGLIGPGERLPAERDLASMLGVSRATVREALSTLAEAGYVSTRRGRSGGTFVASELPQAAPGAPSSAPLTARELDDISTLRRVLEVGAVREAAGQDLTAGERAGLVTALHECAAADEAGFRRLDSRLHLTFAELSGSPSLVQAVADLRTRVNAALDCIPMLPPNLSNSREQHEAIARAILSGRPDAAAEAMAEHIAGTEALLRGFLATGPSAPR